MHFVQFVFETRDEQQHVTSFVSPARQEKADKIRENVRGKCVASYATHFLRCNTQRDDEHSRTRRRLIQFNINCSKTHFLSDSQISRCLFPILSLLFQAERYSLKEKWKGPAITIR